MSGSIFYEDLHVLESRDESYSEMSWRQITQKRGQPTPSCRAAHAGAIEGDFLYMFGGLNKDGAMNDTWRLSLSKWRFCFRNLCLIYCYLVFVISRLVT